MNKIKINDTVMNISLPSLEEKLFSTELLVGKRFMISFFRFASCPFCNLRLHELIERFSEFGDDFTIVAIFDSSIENLKMHTEKHQIRFPILADQSNKYYKIYGIQHSVLGVFKGMIMRFPTLIKGMLNGYLPIVIKGSLTTMPADFLINEKGKIKYVHYGKDEGDHMDIDLIRDFALNKQ